MPESRAPGSAAAARGQPRPWRRSPPRAPMPSIVPAAPPPAWTIPELAIPEPPVPAPPLRAFRSPPPPPGRSPEELGDVLSSVDDDLLNSMITCAASPPRAAGRAAADRRQGGALQEGSRTPRRPPAGTPARREPWLRRPAVLGAIAGVVVLALLAGGFWLYRRHQQAVEEVQSAPVPGLRQAFTQPPTDRLEEAKADLGAGGRPQGPAGAAVDRLGRAGTAAAGGLPVVERDPGEPGARRLRAAAGGSRERLEVGEPGDPRERGRGRRRAAGGARPRRPRRLRPGEGRRRRLCPGADRRGAGELRAGAGALRGAGGPPPQADRSGRSARQGGHGDRGRRPRSWSTTASTPTPSPPWRRCSGPGPTAPASRIASPSTRSTGRTRPSRSASSRSCPTSSATRSPGTACRC